MTRLLGNNSDNIKKKCQLAYVRYYYVICLFFDVNSKNLSGNLRTSATDVSLRNYQIFQNNFSKEQPGAADSL